MITITEQKLTIAECTIFSKETKKFPDIGYIAPHLWNRFPHRYVATIEKEIVGACVAIPLARWVKIGPLIVLKKHHGKGAGKKLLAHTVRAWKKNNLYFGSSNPRVWHMATSLGFRKETEFWKLAREVRWYIIRYILQRFSLTYLVDAMKKRMHQRTYRYFVRPAGN